MGALYRTTTLCLIALPMLVWASCAAHAKSPDDKAAAVTRISSDLLSQLRAARGQQQVQSSASPRMAAVVLKPPSVTAAPVLVTTTVESPPPASAPGQSPKRIFKPMGVGTLPGFEVGVQVSRYKYHEQLGDDPFMNLKGNRIGLEGAYTHKLKRDWFLRAEGRMSYGRLDYSGSGSAKNEPDFMHDMRGLIGKDFAFADRVGISPYAGFGVRNLYNDGRGATSTGAIGYRRRSHYDYIPVGATSRVRLNDTARVTTTLEYDYFKRGEQRSVFRNVDPALGTLENPQRNAEFSGRGNVMYETPTWAFGPWIEYWHIKDSEVRCIPGICGMEPRNETTEVGFRVVRKLN